MPRALIVTEAPVVPEPYRLGLLACGFSVVDEIDDPRRPCLCRTRLAGAQLGCTRIPEELAQGAETLTGCAAPVRRFAPDAALTPFERKYLSSGHVLWRAAVHLP